jgi:hypothetical protein
VRRGELAAGVAGVLMIALGLVGVFVMIVLLRMNTDWMCRDERKREKTRRKRGG